ncbi:MAG TPA: response regulator [Anaeromyxobacteraceae bacterium]|nr:response regulator [Anaeromyxobacteraceae bacterium]
MSRVLVLEDDEATRQSLAAVLRARGYLVACASDGREGLRQLHEQRPDVVLLDLNMPGMDGWEFRRAQLQDPTVADVPIIVVSAQLACEGIGAVAFLEKPCSVNDLLRTLDRAVIH